MPCRHFTSKFESRFFFCEKLLLTVLTVSGLYSLGSAGKHFVFGFETWASINKSHQHYIQMCLIPIS